MQSTVKKASFISGIFLAMVVQFPTSAIAATSLGVITGTTGISDNVASGAFNNLYNFTVGANGDVAYAITAVLFQSSGVSINLADVYQGTLKSFSEVKGAKLVSSSVTSPPFATGDFVITTIGGDAAGLSRTASYTLVISGTSNAASAYYGAISLSPVPEPETYALMSAGLGLMGFMMRRRKTTGVVRRYA
jgi:hypothetical protein